MRYEFKAPRWAGVGVWAEGKTGGAAMERQGCLTASKVRREALLYAAESRYVNLAEDAASGWMYDRLILAAERCYAARRAAQEVRT